ITTLRPVLVLATAFALLGGSGAVGAAPGRRHSAEPPAKAAADADRAGLPRPAAAAGAPPGAAAGAGGPANPVRRTPLTARLQAPLYGPANGMHARDAGWFSEAGT